MKTIQLFAAFLFLFSGAVSAQSKTAVKTSTFKVWGNCGMCKKTIEGTAKTNGATYANWDSETSMLTVKFPASKTSVNKIQKGIANAGYDNVKYTAPDHIYNELDGCCKYDRKETAVTKDGKACCIKDGKCEAGKECCKKVEGKTDCCVAGTCAKEGGCCAGMKCEKGEGCCKKDGAVAVATCCKAGEGTCKTQK